MNRYWWVPAVIVLYSLNAYACQKSGSSRAWFWVLYSLSIVPLWALVASNSKDLARDGLAYDTLMTATFYVTLWFLGGMKDFSVTNYAGAALLVVGMILLKSGSPV